MVTEIMSENEEICPLVSVVCTTYNHEKYIRQCLDGFVMQKTTFPIEIIVHDDASTDDTVRIVKEYEEKYPNLFNNIIPDRELVFTRQEYMGVFVCSKSEREVYCAMRGG